MDEKRLTTRQASGVLLRAFVAAVAAAIVAGIVVVNAPSPVAGYESRAVLLIDQPNAVASSGDEGVIVKLIRLRVKYSDLLRTDPLAGPIAEELDLPLGEVKSRLRTELPLQSLLLAVVGTGSNPEAAQEIAQAAAESIQTYAVEEQIADGIAEDEQVDFEIVDQADPGVRAGNARSRRVTVSILAAGITILLVLAVLEASSRWWRKGRPPAET